MPLLKDGGVLLYMDMSVRPSVDNYYRRLL